MYYIVGLGNPGEEYELTRHNTGRIVLGDFIKQNKVELDFNKKLKVLVGNGKVGKEKLQVIFPETFMNKSGLALKPVVTSKKKGEKLVVVHDDLDLPVGKIKISFGKKSGGHKGIESIIRNIKTKDFIRIRVGISPSTPKGKIRKPDSKKILDFIVGKFKPTELAVVKKQSKKITSAIEMILLEGIQKTMSVCN